MHSAELGDFISALEAELGDSVSRDVMLGPYTTYGVGGPAAVFLTANSAEDLLRAARIRAGTTVPVLTIGLGSNLLISDQGFEGLVVLMGSAFSEVVIEGTKVHAGAGAKLPVVARQSAAAGLTGFEWASGIPGTIGGAVRMNAGVHEADMSTVLERVRVIDLATGDDGVMGPSSLELDYRHSSLGPSQVVVWAELSLQPGDPEVSRAAIKEKTQWRRDNQPGGRNAGSVFANPEGHSAGRLIDEVGLKGLRVGSAEVSPKHANFIVVDQNGSAQDVWQLMVEIRQRVFDTTSVVLQPENKLIALAPLPDPSGADNR